MQLPFVIYWLILIFVLVLTGIGFVIIIRKNYVRYGLISIISITLSILLCWFFEWNGFYRFVLPFPSILPAVAISFTFLVLFSIYFRPKKHTFPFYFMVINLVFAIEIILRDVCHFIVYRGPWDTWDSYSLYWLYIRLFAFLGDCLVPIKYRKPISSDKRSYWISFIVVIIASMMGLVYQFSLWHRVL
jgi:hypothetical protein